MYRVKIYGAGSVGNHLAHAARHLGWDVTVCDVSDAALDRMKNDIYPARYGEWDNAIQLFNSSAVLTGGFDLIFIGTPPESHLPLAMQSLREGAKAILIEKPLCPPSLDGAQELYEMAMASATKVFVGYDHVVGKATRKVEELLEDGVIGEIKTLDVEFREHWGGVFSAHWWLSGPEDTYLGYSERGGGASGEHSHAANLWQHFAHLVGAGRVVEVNAMLKFAKQGKAVYDELCFLDLKTESGLVGRVVQDVVTTSHRKRAKIQGTKGAIGWVYGYNPEGDAVLLSRPGTPDEVFPINRKRPDDFIQELKHLQEQLEGSDSLSGISLERGLDTMLVIAGAHLSESKKCRVQIDFDKAYILEALCLCRS
jgi:predicted dehydrogenase